MPRPGWSRSAKSLDAERRFRQRVAELGGQVIEPTWLGVSRPHRVVCKNGHECSPWPQSVNRGEGLCPTCAKVQRPVTRAVAAEAAFRRRVAELGGRVIEPTWLGSNELHRVACSRDHHHQVTPGHVQSGKGICRLCGLGTAAADEEFRRRVADLGGRVVEPRWLGSKRLHHVVCRNGHDCDVSPSALRKKTVLCRACDPIVYTGFNQLGSPKASASMRWFYERVGELKGRVVESEWLGMKVEHRVICADGHEIRVCPEHLRRRVGMCVICAGRAPGDAERRFRARVSELGGQVIEPTWLGSTKPHRIICPEGHEGRPYPSNVKRGEGICIVCSGRDPVTAERRFRKRLDELGITLLEPRYLGASTPHRAICAKGHGCRPNPNQLTGGGGGCAACGGRDTATAERSFRARIAKLGGKLHSDYEWKGSFARYLISCPEGHEVAVMPTSIAQGAYLCRKCLGKVWDVFYVVSDPTKRRVKFGITSSGGKKRIATHRAAGYGEVIRFMPNRPDADRLEANVIATLADARIEPVSGREHFDMSALPVILDIADHWI
jgi:hypothetical protein